MAKQVQIGISRTALLLGMALPLMGGHALAQAVFGSIYGTVTDNTGAAIPKATVTITDVGKGTSTTETTNDSGEFTADHLIPDTYTVKVEIPGFKTYQQNDIRVFADTSVKVQAGLVVGSTGETVNVAADTVPLLKTDRADVSTTFSSQEVVDLPIPDRNFTNLQLLLPGAQQLGWGHAASENPQGSKQIEVDGQAFAGVNFMLDGTDNQDPILGIIVINPNVDSLSEAKITTQNFDAEFGKAVSSVVTVQTKSGTNAFHGSAFDYRYSAAQLARDPFTQPTGVPSALRNQFGGSLGGPILKDKAFFFVDYQGVRQKVGQSALETVPTSRLLNTCLGTQLATGGINGCDFSDYATAQIFPNAALNANGTPQIIYNNVTNADGSITSTPYANNVIPTAQLSPVFINFLNLVKAGNYTPNTAGALNGTTNNYVANGNGALNDDQWDARVDYQATQNVHAFGRFSRFTDTLTGNPVLGQLGGKGLGLNGYSGTSLGANSSAAAGVDVAVNPKLVFDVRLGYFRYNITTHKYDEGVNFAQQLGIPGLNTGTTITSGAPGFQLNDPGSFGNGTNNSVFGQGLGFNHCNCPLIEHEDQYQLATNFTRTLGNHSVKFGVDLRYARNLRVPSDTDRTGILNIGTGPTGSGSGSDGLSFASFAVGKVATFGRYFSTSTNAKEFQKRFFGYAQDTWRAKPNLTINYGLRYEAYFPETINAPGNGSLLNLDTGYLQVAGVGGVASNMNIGIPKYAFNPRLGINYEVKPGTVIRAGYGRSFDIGVFGSIFGHAATQNLPVLSSQSLVPVGGDNGNNRNYSFLLRNGPPAPAQVTTPANGLLPNPGSLVNSHARPTTERLPTLDAWNAALQQAISNNWSMTVAYVANKGTHTLGDTSGQQTNPNEAGDFLPAQYSVNGQALHYDPSVNNTTLYPGQTIAGISSNNGTSNQTFLQRYYGLKLPACSDPLYASVGGTNAPNGGCGWQNGIQYYGDNLDTHYNALQATLTKAMSHGYSINANYAWQQAISEATNYSTWNRAVVRGRDSSLRQQQIIVYGVFQLPFGKGKVIGGNAKGFVNQLISGYEIDPVVNYSSGLPFTLTFSNCGNYNVGPAPCYVNGDAHSFHKQVSGSPGQNLMFYPAFSGSTSFSAAGYGEAFSTPAGIDQFGSVGRNTVFGPHFFNTDLAVQKSFAIRESIAFILRADGYNAFNHINWGNPNGNIQSGGNINGGPLPVGTVGATRQLQFSGRVQF